MSLLVRIGWLMLEEIEYINYDLLHDLIHTELQLNEVIEQQATHITNWQVQQARL